MPSLPHIRRALADHEPTTVADEGRRRAAVALVLRERDGGLEVLFIERARREGDPWSGHMAFPGGRIEPADADARQAAERETLEEVGVDLEGAERLGRLDDLHGHHVSGVPQLVISAFVYHVPAPPSLETNHEVREAIWFPLTGLLEPGRQVDYRMGSRGMQPLPGIVVGDPDRHVVWGLTYRFLEVFFQVVGRPLPNRWEALRPTAGA